MFKFDTEEGYRRSYSIILIGCGGTGSQLAPSLFQLCANTVNPRKANISSITLVDGDRFELKNTINQKCLKEDVHELKSVSLAEKFKYIYEGLTIYSYNDYLRDAEDLVKLGTSSYSSTVILISCVDNNSTRKLICDAYKEIGKNRDVIYVDAGNGDIDRVGQVVVGAIMQKEVKLPCVGDIFGEVALAIDEDLSTITSCTRVATEHPQNIATNVFSASIVFSVLVNIITFSKVEDNVIYFDADKLSVISRNIKNTVIQ